MATTNPQSADMNNAPKRRKATKMTKTKDRTIIITCVVILILSIVIPVSLMGLGTLIFRSSNKTQIASSNDTIYTGEEKKSVAQQEMSEEQKEVQAKIDFFKSYFSRFEVSDRGDARYTYYTTDMRNNRIDAGGTSIFSMSREGCDIDGSSLRVSHKSGNIFIVSFKGKVNEEGVKAPTAKFEVEIVNQNNQYFINNIHEISRTHAVAEVREEEESAAEEKPERVSPSEEKSKSDKKKSSEDKAKNDKR